ncbi:STAS domain-containing protein [Mycobacterium hubeiense]|uniref:STAS domain-containing protein n=1 Tax=Mycobacterium hubeiense TaxID=1867256 RepID=UPI001E5ABE01|nr:STAS domain-containing protein [Mycobacterium sp. QGD 101]
MSHQGQDPLRPADSAMVHVQRSAGNTSIVHVNGPLLSDTTAPMRRAVANELLRTPELFALNLAGVTNIDAAGLDALTSAATQAGESDIPFCLVGAHQGPVAAALNKADLSDLFEIVPTLNEIGTAGRKNR